jgi:hypothetical protein
VKPKPSKSDIKPTQIMKTSLQIVYRLLLVGAFTWLVNTPALAQRYVIEFNITWWDGVDNHDLGCDNFFEINAYDQDNKLIFPNWREGFPGGYNTKSKKFFFSPNRQVKRLEVRGVRQFKNAGGCKGYDNTIPIPINQRPSQHCFDGFYPESFDFLKNWNCIATVKIYPEEIAIDPFPSGILPSVDKITLNATPGFPSSAYTWQYQTEPRPDWIDFPTPLQSTPNVVFSGQDLMPFDFTDIDKIKNPVRVRLTYGCGDTSKSITLRRGLSSPHITSVTTIPNRCFKEENASVTIAFDRNLIPQELLNIFVSGPKVRDTINLTSLGPGNSITIGRLAAGSNYKIELLGKYPDGSFTTYAQGPGHKRSFDIVGPTEVNFSTASRNIYCKNGRDGTITVSATGGVGNYELGYKKAWQTAYTWEPFVQPGQHTLAALDTGTYQIRVRDGNACFQKVSGKEKIIPVTITQPAQPLRIDYRQVTNPLAAGYKDGSIQVILTGGTPDATGAYTVQWTDLAGNTLTTVTNSTPPFKTVLSNIGNGRYVLRVTDSNFPLAQAASAAGCVVVDTFNVVEPPPLLVDIEVSKIILCRGDANGQLYARARGGIEIPTQRYRYQWFRQNDSNWTDLSQPDSLARNLPAATYKVIITDRNNITKESTPFVLTEPPSLALSLSSTVVSCSGKNDGSAAAIISGGTPPYRIEWSTGDSTLALTNLEEGRYLAFVTDIHGCQIQKQVDVTAPNPIRFFDVEANDPLCYNSCNGSVRFTVSGGVPPYQYQWSNGSTAPQLAGLCAGTYTLTLTDARGCGPTRTFTLKNPAPLRVSLGNDRTLCSGQDFQANPLASDSTARFEWSSDNGFTASAARVTLTNPGTYYVRATTAKGCTGGDTIVIRRSASVISAEFVATTQAFTGDTVSFVNISYPAPPRIEWEVPAQTSVKVIRRTDSLLTLHFAQTGTFSVSLKSLSQDCEKVFTKKITVMQGTAFNNPGTVVSPFIKEFMVSPNPASGEFEVKVGLQEVSRIKLTVMHMVTLDPVHTQEHQGEKSYTVPYRLSLAAGAYMILLETSQGKRMCKLIVQ